MKKTMPCHVHNLCESCNTCQLEREGLLETIRWMAQTIHQAYHEKDTFMKCPKNTCDGARQAIARASGGK